MNRPAARDTAAPLPAIGTRIVIIDGTSAGQHGEVVGHSSAYDHQFVRVRLDGAKKSRLYAPSFVRETGTAQGDLFGGA